eukprot:UN33998
MYFTFLTETPWPLKLNPSNRNSTYLAYTLDLYPNITYTEYPPGPEILTTTMTTEPPSLTPSFQPTLSPNDLYSPSQSPITPPEPSFLNNMDIIERVALDCEQRDLPEYPVPDCTQQIDLQFCVRDFPTAECIINGEYELSLGVECYESEEWCDLPLYINSHWNITFRVDTTEMCSDVTSDIELDGVLEPYEDERFRFKISI